MDEKKKKKKINREKTEGRDKNDDVETHKKIDVWKPLYRFLLRWFRRNICDSARRMLGILMA